MTTIDLKTITGEVVDTTPDDAAESDPGSFEVILSTNDLDRDDEIVDPGAFNPLPDHLPMDVDHGLSLVTTAGSGVPQYDDDGKTLRVRGAYASTDLGQTTRTLVNEKHIRTTSAAFRTLEKYKGADGKTHIAKAMLITGTFTPVAANLHATVVDSKSLDIEDLDVKVGKRNAKADASKIQDIHDMASGLGAACAAAAKTDKSLDAVHVQVKSLVGSVEALQGRVRDALTDLYPTEYGWITVRGVVPSGDGGGYAVFQIYGSTEFDSDETYQESYVDDGAVVTLAGDPTIVDIHEIVAPDADAAEEDAEPLTDKSATGADDLAALAVARVRTKAHLLGLTA